jgi:hypothetical protein
VCSAHAINLFLVIVNVCQLSFLLMCSVVQYNCGILLNSCAVLWSACQTESLIFHSGAVHCVMSLSLLFMKVMPYH